MAADGVPGSRIAKGVLGDDMAPAASASILSASPIGCGRSRAGKAEAGCLDDSRTRVAGPSMADPGAGAAAEAGAKAPAPLVELVVEPVGGATAAAAEEASPRGGCGASDAAAPAEEAAVRGPCFSQT